MDIRHLPWVLVVLGLSGLSACSPVLESDLPLSSHQDDDSSLPGLTATPDSETPTPDASPTPTLKPGDTPTIAPATETPDGGSSPTPDDGSSPTPDGGSSPTPDGGPTPTPAPDEDADGDGFSRNEADCNDYDQSTYPGADEVPYDGRDQDCDGQDLDDVDVDGFTAEESGGPDCDDDDPEIYPGVTERCDGRDENCDGQIDEGLPQTTYYRDMDSDGVGSTSSITACTVTPGYVTATGDCNDLEPSIHPGVEEQCDGVDQDCDGEIDEGVTQLRYADVDGDGFGDSAVPLQVCGSPAGTAAVGADCDDHAPEVYPDAIETCDGRDNDCDGAIDEDLKSIWYADADGDGYGDPASTTEACASPSGYVARAGDCADADGQVNPDATEICNFKDDDCDGSTDEGFQNIYYLDSDGDGYGTPASTTAACSLPAGYSSTNTDCNDGNASVHPGATEAWNGIDDDCDGLADIPASCQSIKSQLPSAASGVYKIDPDGASANSSFDVYCEMSLQSGGWTLLAIFTNNDGKNWTPDGTNWVNTSTFGTPTVPTKNADAKSRAYSELNIDRLMIVSAPSTVEVVTSAGCVANATFLSIMKRNSSSATDCARACSTTTLAGPWTGNNCQDSKLRFRCMDTDSTSSIGGYLVSQSDNSFVTTLVNSSSCRDNTYGLGSSEYVWGSDSDDDFTSTVSYISTSPGDKNHRLLFGR